MANQTPRHLRFQADRRPEWTCKMILADVGVERSLSSSSKKRGSGRRKRIILARKESIYVYSPETGALEMSLEGHEDNVWALAAMDGLLVSGGNDLTVRVWDLERKGKCLHVFRRHTGVVECLAIVKPEMAVDVGGESSGDGV